ncbi:cytochrome [Prauserella coralliicola]|nr:cytochrome [Prauserella coralliicola]
MANALPMTRSTPLDPPAELLRLGGEEPLSRLAYPDGHLGWLVASHELAKTVLADTRFSSRSELLRSAVHPTRVAEINVGDPPPPGFFAIMDPPDHTRYRRLLTGQFTVRRMSLLRPKIEEVVRARLDALEEAGPPADLVTTFALPIPSLVICELLGVPKADRGEFERHGSLLNSLEATPGQIAEGMAAMSKYLVDLIERKRTAPQEDLLSRLADNSELTDEQLAGVAILVLVAGHDTTASMLALGTLTLLNHPAQADALRAGTASADNAVEELLRYLTIVQFGLPRTAVEDVQLAGQVVKAGETVTVSLPAANRDGRRFADPGRLDFARDTTGHLGFGYGVHQCLGQHLARIEMQTAYPALLRRFPKLRLAVPQDDLQMRRDHLIYGVARLPVTW